MLSVMWIRFISLSLSCSNTYSTNFEWWKFVYLVKSLHYTLNTLNAGIYQGVNDPARFSKHLISIRADAFQIQIKIKVFCLLNPILLFLMSDNRVYVCADAWYLKKKTIMILLMSITLCYELCETNSTWCRWEAMWPTCTGKYHCSRSLAQQSLWTRYWIILSLISLSLKY